MKALATLLFFSCLLVILFTVVRWVPSSLASPARHSQAGSGAAQNSPTVTKIEPPNWWIGLAPEVILLLSGNNLVATNVSCNLPELLVQRTEATADGKYLFVWLKFGAKLMSGTAVCRVTTRAGVTSFELPIAMRSQTLGKFQGLTPSDVIYLIVPDRFANGDPTNDEPADARGSYDRGKPRAYHGGDFRGIRDHLDYLKDLGVTTLRLSSVLKSSTAADYSADGAVDAYAVDPHLGSLGDYKELVTAAHERRMKILLDIAPNHVSATHPWVGDPPLPDWFHGTLRSHASAAAASSEPLHGGSDNGMKESEALGSVTDPHAPSRMYRNLMEGWIGGVLPDMNTENSVVAQYLLQNAIWWAESSGLDGFSIEAFPYVPRQFWAQWHSGLRRVYPRLTTIGEIVSADADVTSFFAGGQKRFDGIDSGVTTIFDYPMYFALRDVLQHGAPAGRLVEVLRRDSVYARPGDLVTFFANPDTPRLAGMGGSSAAKVKLAFGLTLTLRGIPEIYYGDEIGMSGGLNKDSRADFPGGWPGDAKNAFEAEGRTAAQQEIFVYVQTLLRLRQAHKALCGGRLWHLAQDETSYVFLRENEEERLVVAVNGSEQSRELRIPLADTPIHDAGGISTVFGEARAQIAKELRLTVPAQSLSIFSVN